MYNQNNNNYINSISIDNNDNDNEDVNSHLFREDSIHSYVDDDEDNVKVIPINNYDIEEDGVGLDNQQSLTGEQLYYNLFKLNNNNNYNNDINFKKNYIFNNNNSNYNNGGYGSNYFRTLVSGKKKRFIQDGFNLDLSYITERIIAMGYPADSSVHKMFRNDINQVFSFFETYHQNHWKIINVAQEISYSHTKLNGNVWIHSFADHTPPPFLLLIDIVKVIDNWLSENPENVVAIHCKAGKGRTGTVISAYLVHLLKNNVPEIFNTSDSILSTTLHFFNSMRSTSGECVSVPSQKRYVGYYISYLKGEIPYQSLVNPPIYRIVNIEVLFLPSSILITSIEIHNRYNPSVKSLPLILHKKNSNSMSNDKYLRFEPSNLKIEGDILIRFNQMNSTQSVFKLVFHTAFIKEQQTFENDHTTLTFNKSILDGPSSGALDDNRIGKDFQLRITLEACNQQQQQQQQYLVSSIVSSTQRLNITSTTSAVNIPLGVGPPPPVDRSKKPILSYHHQQHNLKYHQQLQQSQQQQQSHEISYSTQRNSDPLPYRSIPTETTQTYQSTSYSTENSFLKSSDEDINFNCDNNSNEDNTDEYIL